MRLIRWKLEVFLKFWKFGGDAYEFEVSLVRNEGFTVVVIEKLKFVEEIMRFIGLMMMWVKNNGEIKEKGDDCDETMMDLVVYWWIEDSCVRKLVIVGKICLWMVFYWMWKVKNHF